MHIMDGKTLILTSLVALPKENLSENWYPKTLKLMFLDLWWVNGKK